MITGGSSSGAWLQGSATTYVSMKEQEAGPVSTAPGLGFFPFGVIDQHFDRKARLGRLVYVLLDHPDEGTGFGVDEDTALIFDRTALTIGVAGRGNVTRVRTAGARVSGAPPHRQVTGVTIDLLSPGDQLHLGTGEIVVATGRQPTTGREYYAMAEPLALGVFQPYGGSVRDLVGHLLVDNEAVRHVDSYLWDGRERGYRIRFLKTTRTEGFYGNGEAGLHGYTALQVGLEMTPVRFQVETVE